MGGGPRDPTAKLRARGHCVCRWSFNSTQLSFPSRYQRPFEFSNGCGQYTTCTMQLLNFTDCAPDGRLSFQTCMGRTESAILGGTLQKFWKLKETHTYTFTVSKTHMRACVRAFMPKAYILIMAVSRFSCPDCFNLFEQNCCCCGISNTSAGIATAI